ncbi:hypothetical protein FB446DRAFT_795311 [Lentinula raphanica]|nr:hypothetical protein FB446DRAFT_795311 [Lentinula raphanica]
MPVFSPLGATLDQIFERLILIVQRWSDERQGMIVRPLNLEEIKVLEYLSHVEWIVHERGGTIIANRLWDLAADYSSRMQQIRRHLRNETNDGVPEDVRDVSIDGIVPFEFFTPTRTFWMGPYAEKWSLQVVRPSPSTQLHWNNPFDLNKSVNYNLLTEPVPDLIHRVAFTPSERTNGFFTRRPLDSTTRRDFTVRFLYEEEATVLLGGEERAVIIYHIVHRRDIDFTLDHLEYESHISTNRGPRRGPRSTLYAFTWNHNLVEHKVHHRFYQQWLDEERTKWVVRERGTGRYVRGRRNAIEQEAFKMWMNREEDIHPAWQGSLEAFEVCMEEATDHEWVIDYKQRLRHAYEYWPDFLKGT